MLVIASSMAPATKVRLPTHRTGDDSATLPAGIGARACDSASAVDKRVGGSVDESLDELTGAELGAVVSAAVGAAVGAAVSTAVGAEVCTTEGGGI